MVATFSRQAQAIATHHPKSEVAVAPERPKQKTFQYAGHYRDDHNYSPFHQKLDSALKHFYSKSNLQTVLLKKELISFPNLYLLDHATVDIWPGVVMVKIPKWIPSQSMLMYERSPQSFCRFISKRDFLEAVIEFAMLQGRSTHAHGSKVCPELWSVQSTNSKKVYDLTVTQRHCDCSCPAYQSLNAAFSEDARMLALLIKHPTLQGQLPDKHIFSLWATWGAKNFKYYQFEQGKRALAHLGITLQCVVPGHYTVYYKARKLGTVDQRWDDTGKTWWDNQRQISLHGVAVGDRIQYTTEWDAAIGLAQLLQVIDDGSKALDDLFGGGWDEPTASKQPIDFAAAQERKKITNAAAAKGKPDPFGGFSF